MKRRLALVWTLCGLYVPACDADDPVPPKGDAKVVRGVDVHRIPVPNHGPDVMAGRVDKAVRVTNEGFFRARFHDKPREFKHFSPGDNAAVYAENDEGEDDDVGRLMLAAAEDESGYPRVELRIENVRLDTMELPVTFPLDSKAVKKVPRVGGKEPDMELRYLEDEARFWKLDPNDTEAGQNRVTLSSFEGKTLRGKIRARLVPNVKTMGEVIEIEDSDFEVELRLRGIRPARAASDVQTP